MKLVQFLFFIMLIFLTGCSSILIQTDIKTGISRKEKKVEKIINHSIQTIVSGNQYPQLNKAVKLDSIQICEENKQIKLFFNKYLSYVPLRIENVDFLYSNLHNELGYWFRKYDLEILTLETQIEQLVPNFFRNDTSAYDISRIPNIKSENIVPIVRRVDWKAKPTNGLNELNIAMWHSHGWYYSINSNRWEWQRPRLFQTVEDLLPFSFVVPYIVPMLENSGANIFLPRERDWQTNEIIVDNDSADFTSQYVEYENENIKWQTGEDSGFGLGEAPYETGENPFSYGSYRFVESKNKNTAKIEWIPEIPEEGNYSVYISYKQSKNNVTDAHYTVYHLGGKTRFLVNQQIGGGTWIYLGKFHFSQGYNPDFCKVELTNESEISGQIITADAIRFGGGMGDVKRGNSISHRPRFVEGARYYLQYAGMPDTLIYHTNDNKNDYKDDYTSRAEWVNYLTGSPNGPNKNRNIEGLGIPIDISFSFHTDAGITRNDKVVGTLSIYSLQDFNDDISFPTGYSRLANRDLADIVQTQIVNDAQAKYDYEWNRRSLHIGKYSEAFRPNVPSMLLELLSHQNFQDMKFGMDPKFRFDISRAIYKGILKYLSNSNGYEYVVQPLPVNHFQATFTNEKEVTLKWKEQTDKLEPTAKADKYIVYTRINDLDFDNGQIVDSTECIMKNLEIGVQYSFKITAINTGGESFPSEILSVCWVNDAKETVLIVNNFDRISSAGKIENGNFRGFANFIDEGVPDKYDIGFTGTQHDYSSSSKWLTNDNPGWGASSANYETKIIAGNSFDYPYMHGKSIRNCGYSYVSTSDESVENCDIFLNDYRIIDMIIGEEKSEEFSAKNDSIIFKVFSDSMMNKISNYCKNGGNIFMSGAYLGSDLFESPKDSSLYTDFARNVLKYNFVTNHASIGGKFHFVEEDYKFYNYNNNFSKIMYKLEAPDAIQPAKNSGAKTFLRFGDNEFSAGISFQSEKYNLVITTIPFETILNQTSRDEFMSHALKILK